MSAVPPLPVGSILDSRYEIEDALGRGGFSVVYSAIDRRREDRVVLKELAPAGSQRGGDGYLDLGSDAARLRSHFVEEAAVQSKFNVRGLVPIRGWFSENGTAYIVSERLVGAETLHDFLLKHGPLTVDGALDIFFQLLETVEAIHLRGVLHRDIKPSNVLITPNGAAYLIDFGSAREWQTTGDTSSTILFTPGFAPPEQFSTTAKRGPATDIYALCATLFQMIVGHPPTNAVDRSAGAELLGLDVLRSRAGSSVANAVEAGMTLNMTGRPQSIAELRALLEEDAAPSTGDDLLDLDERLYQSQRFSFDKRECPACGGVLEEAKPIAKNVCPVCRKGIVQQRRVDRHLCPVCRAAPLKRHENGAKPYICPHCGIGVLTYARKGLLSSQIVASCPECRSTGEFANGKFTLAETHGVGRQAPRASVVWKCDSCDGQFDEVADGQWEQVGPPPRRYTRLYPDEWANVAAGLPPGSGNAECDACGADFYLDSNTVTLLSAAHDPHRFAADYEGRRLRFEDLRWLAAGKSSPHAGFVCEQCHTEFDSMGEQLVLVHSTKKQLASHSGETRALEDWHRLARRLPQKGYEEELRDLLPRALREGYWRGDVGFEGQASLAWKGPAQRLDIDQEGTFTIDHAGASFGGLIKKWKSDRNGLVSAFVQGDDLSLETGDGEVAEFELEPMDLTAHLKSGPCTISLTAEDLAQRLRLPAMSFDAEEER